MNDPRSHLEKAKSLLANDLEDSIQIAALQLRMCMEVLTYDKLRTYADRVPSELQRIWQPPQAVRALLELEPEADQDFEVHIGDRPVDDLHNLEGIEWLPLGSHKTTSAKWLGKHYHKIGSFLHASFDESKAASGPDAQRYLAEVLADLEAVLSGTLWGSPFPLSTFVCVECGSVVARNTEELRKGKLARCFKPSCGAEYRPKIGEQGEVSVELITEHPPCSRCKQPMSIKPALLAVGARMTCRHCSLVHTIIGRSWQYAPIET